MQVIDCTGPAAFSGPLNEAIMLQNYHPDTSVRLDHIKKKVDAAMIIFNSRNDLSSSLLKRFLCTIDFKLEAHFQEV